MVDTHNDVTSVERSIVAVTAIRQVLHAIWALSRAQMPLAEQAASAAVVYERWIDEAVERVAGAPRSAKRGRVLHVVFGPERPFSGALTHRIADVIPEDGELGLVGRRLAESIGRSPRIAARVRFRCAGSVAHDDLHDVALAVAEQILTCGVGASIVVVHPTDIGTTFVPLIGARVPVDRPPETFSRLEQVVEAVVREAMMGRLAVAAVEALRAEVRSRMIAAEVARHACDERLAELESVWHRGRREAVTREVLETVAGRESLPV